MKKEVNPAGMTDSTMNQSRNAKAQKAGAKQQAGMNKQAPGKQKGANAANNDMNQQ